MARELLGNIKGPKGDTGPKGDKGDTGGFNGESIGVINKLDVSQPDLLQSGDTWEFDKETGVVNYNFSEGHFIGFDVELEPRVHTFRIEDFTDNSIYNGDFRFQVRDSNNEYIHRTNVPKKGYYTFDLTSYEGVEKYKIHFYREAGEGFFEKPMLVEGDYSVLWNTYRPVKDHFMTSILNQSVTGSLSNPNVVALSQIEADTNLNFDDNTINLTSGLWQITVNTRFSPVTFEGSTFIMVYLNEDYIIRINLPPTMEKEKAFSHIFKVTENSSLTLRVGKSTTDTLTFEGTKSNNLSLVKLSEI